MQNDLPCARREHHEVEGKTMRWVPFVLVWLLVFLAAGYDAHFAWQYRVEMQDWELNPLARWGASTVGLPGVLVFKFAGLAFAGCLAAYCHQQRRKAQWSLTLTVACAYLMLSMHYFAGHQQAHSQAERRAADARLLGERADLARR